MNNYVIIVAGGSGSRMGSNLPKQFLLLNKKPVLMHTIERFNSFNPKIKIILVLPDSQKDYWAKLCLEYSFQILHQVVGGGLTRFESVKNGLSVIDNLEECLIAIHDGVRPLVSTATIKRCFETAEIHGNAVPCININDSLRKIEANHSKHVDRAKYKSIQTPQVFNNAIIQEAYKQAYSDLFTDDASVVEANGTNINLVEGNSENLKITTPFDLMVAEAIIKYE